MFFTRNSKVEAMVRRFEELIESQRRGYNQQIQAIREQNAQTVESLMDRIAQLSHQLSMANIFVAGNGTLEEQVAGFDAQHAEKIQTADDLRTLAYKMLETADDVDAEAAFIGELADVGRQMMANRAEVITTEMSPAVAAALATYENVDENEEEENES